MKRTSWMLVVVLSSCSIVGCGAEEGTTEPAPAEQPAAGAAPHQQQGQQPEATESAVAVSEKPEARIAEDAAPESVVTAFLDAMRDGNEQIMGGLLTNKAWEETSKEGFVVRPPGAPSAAYDVGDVEFEPDNSFAYVRSVWSELAEEGETENYDIVWVLREQADGWRIAGMATPIVEGQPPLVLNFEDPAEMKQKLEQVSAELSASQEEQVQQARQQPQDQENTLR